ncbi:unnamed protein product, partial [Chrysoparadoxa australica]
KYLGNTRVTSSSTLCRLQGFPQRGRVSFMISPQNISPQLLLLLWGFCAANAFMFGAPAMVRARAGQKGLVRLHATSPTEVGVREEKKAALLASCDEFKRQQQAMWDDEERERKDLPQKKWKPNPASPMMIALNSAGNQTISLIEDLAAAYPAESPLLGWRGFGGKPAEECLLDGTWKLRFTTAADATFRPKGNQSIATSQEVSSSEGTLTNVIDVTNSEGKSSGFRVVVEGKAMTDRRMELIFRRVIISLSSRWLKRLTVYLPSFRWIRACFRWWERNKEVPLSGAFFDVRYLDPDLRIHQTGEVGHHPRE